MKKNLAEGYKENSTQKERLLEVLKSGKKVCQIDLNYYMKLRDDEENADTFQKRYLEVLLYTLSRSYDSWDRKFQKIIKQAIRQEDWEV